MYKFMVNISQNFNLIFLQKKTIQEILILTMESDIIFG